MMKQMMSNTFKLLLITLLVYFSPISEGFNSFIHQNISASTLLFNVNSDIDGIDTMSFLINSYKEANLSNTSLELNNYQNDKTISLPKENIKRGSVNKVLIYSTHQNEEYLDYGGVIEASHILAEELEAYGIDVVIIEEDFLATAAMYGYNYNKLYAISRMFLEEYLLLDEYDLIIDFHRDALLREQTYIEYNGVKYAKIMADIGINNPNNALNMYYATSLTDKISSYGIPIMKDVYTIASNYNQDLRENIILIEFGSDTNYYQEVLNSIKLVARGIAEIRW